MGEKQEQGYFRTKKWTEEKIQKKANYLQD